MSPDAAVPRVGTVEFPTSGSRAAQPHFERGVAALHSFWYDEALAAFEAALQIDPDFAMARWGIAMACKRPFMDGSDDVTGRRVLAEIPHDAALTDRERAHIEALRVWYSDGTLEARAATYAAAMKQLHEAYPTDHEAALFYVLSLLGHDWPDDPELSRHRAAGALALELYRRRPDHPGAAHYVIHSFDDPRLATRALPAARHYAQIAPDVPHALHMPSHIFLQLGMWPETVAANEAAWAASETWVRRKQASPAQRDYHNLHWLIYGCLQEGRYNKARELLDQFRAMRSEIPPQRMHFFEKAAAAYIIETRRWEIADEIVTPPPIQIATTSPATRASIGAREWCGPEPFPVAARNGRSPADIPGFVRAFAAAARGSSDADKRLDQLVADAGGTAMPEFWQVRVRAIAAVSNARIGAFDAAIKTLRQATAIEDDLGRPPGPPAAYKPPHELLGEILLRAGKPAEAAEQFRVNLARHPNRSLSVLGLARAHAALGDRAAARRSYELLLELWRNADSDLPERDEARNALRDNHG